MNNRTFHLPRGVLNIFLWLRRFIYTSLLVGDKILRRNPSGLYVFCYHKISDDTNRWSVSFPVFKKQINYLIANYKPVSFEEIKKSFYEKHSFLEPSFLLTFDDGFRIPSYVKEHLTSLRISPIVFVLSDKYTTKNGGLLSKNKFLTDNEIIKLKKLGWEIGCHGASHRDLTKMDLITLSDEILKSKLSLEKRVGFKISCFSYPMGMYTKAIKDITKMSKYNFAFSMDDDCVNEKTDHFAVPRIGVDKSHTLSEFKVLMSPSVVSFKKMFKQVIGSIV